LNKKPCYSNLCYSILEFTNKEKEDINNVLLNNKEYLARQVNKYLSYEDTLNAKIKTRGEKVDLYKVGEGTI